MLERKVRRSNLELLRIVSMLIIIAHHYVVNSGLTEMYDYQNISLNMIFCQILGSGGKMAINIFVIISCYFMCQQRLTWKRVIRLYLEIKIYSISIFFILVLLGYNELTIANLVKLFFNQIYSINVSFTGSFLFFYLLIPFLNRAISQFSRKTHKNICIVLLFLFTIISTFSLKNDTWNYIGWYVTLYFVASYIKLYPCKYTENIQYGIVGTVTTIIFSIISILVVDFLGVKYGFTDVYYLLEDSHKLLAFLCAISIFILFKNMNIKNNRCVNMVATTTFGVFLIHTRGEGMRTFLWRDILKNIEYYESNYLVIHAIISILGIFVVCAIIDGFRIKFIEKPLVKQMNKIDCLDKECFVE